MIPGDPDEMTAARTPRRERLIGALVVVAIIALMLSCVVLAWLVDAAIFASG